MISLPNSRCLLGHLMTWINLVLVSPTGAVGLCQSCVTDGRKLFRLAPTHYWKARVNSHRPGSSERLLVRCVCAPVFHDCHSWLRQSCRSASFSSGFYFLAACSLIRFRCSQRGSLFTITFLFFFFFTPPSVWHICCWTLGHLHSAVINLLKVFLCSASSRLPPTPCCLPLFSQPSLSWHLTHRSVTPPATSFPPHTAHLLCAYSLSHTVSSQMRWEGCSSVIDMLCKDTCQQQAHGATAAAFGSHLLTDLS